MTVLQLDAERRGDSGVAYGVIKEQIIRCQLAPGTRVTEARLAAELHMGKTPVREALQRLTNEGLVQVMPRHGYQVTPITLRDVQDIFGLRLILEAASARLAAGHVDAEHLRRLDLLCQAGYIPGDRESEAAFLRANTELHATVARATGNRQLAEVMVAILSRMERLFHLGLALRNRTEEMAHEHRDLVEALIVGDGDEAYRIMTEQMRASQRMVTAALLSSPQLLAVNVTTERPGEGEGHTVPLAPGSAL